MGEQGVLFFSLCMCVGYVCMWFQVSTCKGQRTVSGVSPCLLPCLRQGLLIFFFSAAYVVSWPQSFSCLHLPSSRRSAIFLQERHLPAGALSSCRSASITEYTLLCTIISGFYVSSWNSNLGPHTFVAPQDLHSVTSAVSPQWGS